MTAPSVVIVKKRKAQISWRVEGEIDATILSWEVYASKGDDEPGERVASVGPNVRTATVQVEEGEVTFRVLWRSRGGKLQPHESAEKLRYDPSGATLQVSAPSEVAVGPVDAGTQGAVEVAPAAAADDSQVVQVIEHDDGQEPTQGVLVAERPVESGAMDLQAGFREPGIPFPVAGWGLGRDHVVSVRGRGAGGAVGAPHERTTFLPKRYDEGEITLIDVDVDTMEYTGWPAAAATDFWEYDAADGVRMRQIPTENDPNCDDWGTETGGIICDLGIEGLVYYVNKGTIESEVIDLGKKAAFVVDIYANWRRKQTGCPPGVTEVDAEYPGDPRVPEDLEGTGASPDWLGLLIDENGVALQPIRPGDIRWEYRVSDDNVLFSDWFHWRDGAWALGRYVQVRVSLYEPTGLYQLHAKKILVRARRKKIQLEGREIKPAAQNSLTVNFPLDPDTGLSPYLPGELPVVHVTVENTASPPAIPYVQPTHTGFTVTFYDAAGAIVNADEVTFGWSSSGY